MGRDTLLVDIDSAGELIADIEVAAKALHDSPAGEYLHDLENQLAATNARIRAGLTERKLTQLKTKKWIAELKASSSYKWAYDRLEKLLPAELLPKLCPRSANKEKLLEYADKADKEFKINFSQCYEESTTTKLDIYPAP